MEKKAKTNLKKLEQICREIGYTVRYEKGNFTPGTCVLHGKRVIVVNKLFTPEGKVACLSDLISGFLADENLTLNEESFEIFHEIKSASETD
jgi:hypothetical protein